MSNHLAVATVTATLRDMLQGVAGQAVAGANVTITRPEKAGDGDQKAPTVNIFLYQVAPNAGWRNADLPTRRPDGSLAQRPQAALDLHYLLSFYGDEVSLEPQRLLGSVVAALHAQPVLSPGRIRTTLQTASDDAFAEETVLKGSDLAEQIEQVRFTPTSLSLEELSKLWSIFQVPYALSVTYQASLVLIEGADMPRPVLPTRRVQVKLGTGPQPVPGLEGAPRATVKKVPASARRSKGLEVEVEPAVRRGQKVLLVLNGVDGGPAYTLEAPENNGIPKGETETDTILFALEKQLPGEEKPVPLVEPGTYLVRVQVDGLDSLPEWDETSGFTGPRVEVSRRR